MRTRVEFVVPGEPVAQGSMIPGQTRAGKLFVRPANAHALQHYRRLVASAAAGLRGTAEWSSAAFPGPLQNVRIPVAVTARFACSRPGPGKRGHHFDHPLTGDVDKFARALLDGLTGVLFKDDAQVIALHVHKRLVREGEPPHTQVLVRLADEEEMGG